ncbi:MAG TPA: TetR/AcrR family transcriptional regulator [Syntrophorhabdaceae bacterium]|nr:TetR/AcrR family transcriptional regulator [Syntrophorhabdaceae bacterium]
MNRRSAEETRRIIADAALKMFSMSGYEGTNMRMIANEAGISVGALYLYHKSKEELCFTLLKRLFNDFFEEIKNKIDGIDDPAEQVRAYVETYMALSKKHRQLILAFNKEKGFTFGVESKREFFLELRLFVGKIIKSGIEKGVFYPSDEKEATKVLISMLRGYVLSIVIDPENLFTSEACTDIFLNGLIKRRGSYGKG